MTGDGLATVPQSTMATLCGSMPKHEAGTGGDGHGLRDPHHSTGWAERVSDAPIARMLPRNEMFVQDQ